MCLARFSLLTVQLLDVATYSRGILGVAVVRYGYGFFDTTDKTSKSSTTHTQFVYDGWDLIDALGPKPSSGIETFQLDEVTPESE